MSTVAEIKQAIDQLSPPEPCELEALRHPWRSSDTFVWTSIGTHEAPLRFNISVDALDPVQEDVHQLVRL